MPEDLRQHVRYPVTNTVFIELVTPEFGSNESSTIVKCNTLDISRGGLRVWLEQALPVGAILQVGVELPASAGTLFLVAEIIWCQPIPDAGAEPGWAAGLALLNADDSDFDNWVALVATMAS